MLGKSENLGFMSKHYYFCTVFQITLQAFRGSYPERCTTSAKVSGTRIVEFLGNFKMFCVHNNTLKCLTSALIANCCHFLR